MSKLTAKIGTALPKYVCASEQVKLIGSLDGMFPEFGHHQEKEMGGLWLHPIKLLDGFWLRFCDLSTEAVDTWILADGFENMPTGNHFSYRGGLGHTRVEIDRYQLAPEAKSGIIIRYVFNNTARESVQSRVAFLARANLSPVWFSEAGGIYDGARDVGAFDDETGMYLAKDCAHEWHLALASNLPPDRVACGEIAGPQGDGKGKNSVMLEFDLELAPGETELAFYIAGSFQSRQQCIQSCTALRDGQNFECEKEKTYKQLLSTARLEGPSAKFCEIFDWVKVHTQWLVQDAGPFGRGLTAGLPEYPWWFGCDNSYALQGLLALGQFELVRDTLRLLAHYSKKHNGNGRILHEVTTHGVCVNPGNTQETAHFLVIVYAYYQYTGDLGFIRELFDDLHRSVLWLQEQDQDGDLFPSGYGIIEIAGLRSELIDTAVYTCLAYRCFADICRLLQRDALGAPWADLAKRLREAINTTMWDEQEGLYCDAHTSYPEVLKNREQILGRLPAERAAAANTHLKKLLAQKKPLGDTESGWLINYNWIINVPMEAGIADEDKAQRALFRLHTDEFIGPFGMYLNALDAHHMMTISTGAMAVAQARYGQADRALELVEQIFKTFSLSTPGCISEMSPDYGCFVQAWTVYAVMVPVIRYFFGIQPDAAAGQLNIDPLMPERWHKAALHDIPVQGGKLDIAWKRNFQYQMFDIYSSGSLPLLIKLRAGTRYEVNGVLYAAEHQDRWVPVPERK